MINPIIFTRTRTLCRPDGLPVSYTEAHAISAWTAQLVYSSPANSPQAPPKAKQPSPLPKQLFVETFLAPTLAELRAGVGASAFLTVAGAAAAGAGGGPTVVPVNASVAVAHDGLVEATVWPIWPAGNTTSASAAGILARANGTSGLFAGVTSDAEVVLELWTGAGSRQRLHTFALASLPPNQEHAAVAGWNMLRLGISEDGRTASVWWNPTHADELGLGRGQRIANVALPSTGSSSSSSMGGQLCAAVCGGASMRLDYISVMQHPRSA
jgi:hypothetical protein